MTRPPPEELPPLTEFVDALRELLGLEPLSALNARPQIPPGAKELAPTEDAG